MTRLLLRQPINSVKAFGLNAKNNWFRISLNPRVKNNKKEAAKNAIKGGIDGKQNRNINCMVSIYLAAGMTLGQICM